MNAEERVSMERFRADLVAAEHRVITLRCRLDEAEHLLRAIANNALVDEGCWEARRYFKAYDFADLPSAPRWFKDEARTFLEGPKP